MSEIEIEIEPKDFWKDKEWVFSHYSELMQKYPNLWVAIVDEKIVSAGEDLRTVREDAKKKTSKKHIPLIFIEGEFSVLEN
ncbi:MAG: DUF5678 domain-containing protein [Methanosarcinales archaeon]